MWCPVVCLPVCLLESELPIFQLQTNDDNITSGIGNWGGVWWGWFPRIRPYDLLHSPRAAYGLTIIMDLPYLTLVHPKSSKCHWSSFVNKQWTTNNVDDCCPGAKNTMVACRGMVVGDEWTGGFDSCWPGRGYATIQGYQPKVSKYPGQNNQPGTRLPRKYQLLRGSLLATHAHHQPRPVKSWGLQSNSSRPRLVRQALWSASISILIINPSPAACRRGRKRGMEMKP